MAAFCKKKEQEEKIKQMHEKRKKLEERDILGRRVHQEDDSNTFLTKVKEDNAVGDHCVREPKAKGSDEFKIYFDRESLIQSLVDMEEDNLFIIHNIQEEEQILWPLQEQCEKNITKGKAEK